MIGAFIFWAIKGFKGKFDDEMVGPGDKSWMLYRNFIVSSLVLLFVARLLGI